MENNFDIDALPDIIKALLSGDEMKNIMGSLKKEDEPTEKPSDAFSLPPDIMEKLPLVMSALSTTIQSAEQKENPDTKPENTSTAIAASLPNVMSALSGLSKTGKAPEILNKVAKDKNRKALLSAIRPYMSDRKKSAIDTMLNFNTLAEIMATLMNSQ